MMFKIGDRVKVDNDLIGLISNTEGIITNIEIRFSDNLNQLYKIYYIENKETEFYAQELELVQTSEQIAVEKKLEEIRKKINFIIETSTPNKEEQLNLLESNFLYGKRFVCGEILKLLKEKSDKK